MKKILCRYSVLLREVGNFTNIVTLFTILLLHILSEFFEMQAVHC